MSRPEMGTLRPAESRSRGSVRATCIRRETPEGASAAVSGVHQHPLAPSAGQLAWFTALSRHSFRPTGRTQVQNSSNFTGVASLPATMVPVVSSTV